MPSPSLPPSNGHSGQNGHHEPATPWPAQGQLYDEAYGQGNGASQLRELLALLWGHKWIILGVFVIVVSAAAIYTYSLPQQYQTSSLLLIKPDSPSTLVSTRGRSVPGLAEDRSISNQLFVLRQSRELAERVAERMDEIYDEGEGPPMMYNPETGERHSVQALTSRLASRIQASQGGEEIDAIRLSATSTDPEEAALIVNLFSEEYVDFARDRSRQSVQATYDFLESQSESLRADMEKAEQNLVDFMQREEAVALDEETSSTVSRITSLESERAQLRIELEMNRSRFNAQEENVESIEPQLAERIASDIDSELARVQEEREQLKSQIEQAQERNPDLTPNSDGNALERELARTQARIDRLDARAEEIATRYVDQALAAGGASPGEDSERGVGYVADQREQLVRQRIEISGMEARLSNIDEQLAENRERLQELPAQSLELAQLQRERRSAEQVYSFVRQQMQETRMTLESEIGNAEVVRFAGVPSAPFAPTPQQNMILAALLGLVLGGGFVIIREMLDTRIRQPEDIRGIGEHLIGVVPSMEAIIERDFDGERQITIDDRTVPTTLPMLVSPMSAVAESYRRLRTNLRFARPDEEVRTVAVTSASKGEGKTTTAANLALALASAGQRTMLVDADLRRPRLHTMFDSAEAPPLVDVLYEGVPDPEVFSTAVDHLYLMPGGEKVPNPAELLGSRRMEDLIGDLEAEFDYLIIDTAPVLLFSDAMALSPFCKGVVMVASAGTTDQRALEHAAHQLREVEAPLIGCVLNNYKAGDSASRYAYNYDNYGYAQSMKRLDAYYRDDDDQPKSRIQQWFGR
ncbi:MAG: GumC family protein [Bacteroidota bacterium]